MDFTLYMNIFVEDVDPSPRRAARPLLQIHASATVDSSRTKNNPAITGQILKNTYDMIMPDQKCEICFAPVNQLFAQTLLNQGVAA